MTDRPAGPVPAAVYEAAADDVEPAELATLIWQVAVIDAWRRVAVTARMSAGVYRPGDTPAAGWGPGGRVGAG